MQATLYQPFRSATPLSQTGLGPEALRPSIIASLPFANDGGYTVFYELIMVQSLTLLIDNSPEKLYKALN
jgi:hypothetical protein